MKTHPSIPTATYRLQFNKDFTIEMACALVPYLKELGISHFYLSPIFKATPGSTHGYDINDHNQLNPEVTTREEYARFAREVTEAGMGIIVDFVPNHMGIAEAANTWWMDVLENGPSSQHALFFDIDWQPLKRELENKVLLPILGDQYGRVLEKGELKLVFSDGVFTVHYYSTVLPVEPVSTRKILQAALRSVREGAAAEAILEMESILTALDHLPARTETEAGKVAERAREGTIIKRRLRTLCEGFPKVCEAIEQATEQIQAPGDEHAYDEFDKLLNAQNYRLSFWRVAGEEINYRRFFDINGLAAIRMERGEVFEAAHRLIFELIKNNEVHGLRIDHVDGLYHPRRYLAKLQSRYAETLGLSGVTNGLYLLVEKILGNDEHLRADWPVHGTTGYEFANQALAVLIDRDAQPVLTAAYRDYVDAPPRFHELVYQSKLVVMRTTMASEVNVLGAMLNRLSETNRWYRDFTLNLCTAAVRELIACFPVYRTYITPDAAPSEDDWKVISRAIDLARRRNPTLDRTVFEFLHDVLLPKAEDLHPVDEVARLEFVMKFQQCSGPIMAKGVEDTAFYNFNRLIALNEVGGEPGIFGGSLKTFHGQNEARLAEFPHCMTATSTHDTKRSEDVRMRIAALSELPEEWARLVAQWTEANAAHEQKVDGETAPSRAEQYLLYQTILGAWPFELMPGASEEYDYESLVKRLQAYMEKAIHEAKVKSSWIEPNQAWDEAARDFTAAILKREPGNAFLESFVPFAQKTAQLGMVNSLAETVLKCTVPGVPDFYQGNEIWDLSLVDPDNRRPVDYDLRRRLLASLKNAPPAELMARWPDGRVKLLVTQRLLQLRGEQPALFAKGSYTPVEAVGEFGECVIAFTREWEAQKLLVIVPRFSSRVGFPPLGDKWRDTAVEAAGAWRELFTGAQLGGENVRIAEALASLPVAVLVSQGEPK
ncbi:MAG TPA: malto-oligosyltrehalose synthase [Chthoniobacteraceae bacterium]|jgi:(1->4)-alpha-D-glucan 1-alpha-D-glucosylmutase|nr:malto-oligosyltrehalose synthase [Chthoniobacteraceae bacterium]